MVVLPVGAADELGIEEHRVRSGDEVGMGEVDPAVEDRDREARPGRLHPIGADRAQVVAQIGGRERVGEADERVAASRRLGVAEDAAALRAPERAAPPLVPERLQMRSSRETSLPPRARTSCAPRASSFSAMSASSEAASCESAGPVGTAGANPAAAASDGSRAEPDGERSGEREHLHGRHGSRRQ